VVTEFLDLKLLAWTILPEEPKIELDLKALLKKEVMLKEEDKEKE